MFWKKNKLVLRIVSPSQPVKQLDFARLDNTNRQTENRQIDKQTDKKLSPHDYVHSV